MKMEIYKDGEMIDLQNVSITKFENKLFQLGQEFYNTDLNFSSIKQLKGDKDILEKAFLHQFIEELNL